MKILLFSFSVQKGGPRFLHCARGPQSFKQWLQLRRDCNATATGAPRDFRATAIRRMEVAQGSRRWCNDCRLMQ